MPLPEHLAISAENSKMSFITPSYMEVSVRLKEEQIARLAEKVLTDLTTAGLIALKKERGTALAGIREVIAADLQGEAALEKDAEALLEQTLRAMGRGAADIDRHKMLRMIKEKLARERKIVL